MGSEGLADALCSSATSLFAMREFAAVSLREIVEMVGCSKPAIYYHFGNKDALLVAVVSSAARSFATSLQRTSCLQSTPAADQLTRLISTAVQWARSNCDKASLLRRAKAESTQPAVQGIALAARDSFTSRVGSCIEEGMRTHQLRRDVLSEDCAIIVTGFTSLLIEASLSRDDSDEFAQRAVKILLEGIR